ncbi:hypothetical protein BD779DRAFT_1608800 [Infundibulicybe gibba]|nr:hypothetical protein BD779DRAFT_1608800 [Infundibulicybe gibba]
MPICTTCTNFVPYLYTIYQSKNNLRLEPCLNILLDLLLLKRGVYRHLLYNRGAEPNRAHVRNENATNKAPSREKGRWFLVVRLGLALILMDAFSILFCDPEQPAKETLWTQNTIGAYAKVLLGCLAETLAFHMGIILSTFIVFKIGDRLSSWGTPGILSDIRREFRFSLIPLALFYSSLTKLFLLFFLTIWRPSTQPSRPLAWDPDGIYQASTQLKAALSILDDDKLDREWVIRNVLGGMSAGFGLRVIFDSHPAAIAVIILAGWKAKTLVSNLVSGWVGGDDGAGRAWLAYSTP